MKYWYSWFWPRLLAFQILCWPAPEDVTVSVEMIQCSCDCRRWVPQVRLALGCHVAVFFANETWPKVRATLRESSEALQRREAAAAVVAGVKGVG